MGWPVKQEQKLGKSRGGKVGWRKGISGQSYCKREREQGFPKERKEFRAMVSSSKRCTQKGK